MNITIGGSAPAYQAEQTQASQQAASSQAAAAQAGNSKSSVSTDAYTVNLSSGKGESGEAPSVGGKDGDNDGH